MADPTTPELLLSLPPAVAAYLRGGGREEASAVLPHTLREYDTYTGNDPAGRKLGSGGGTVHLLRSAWAASEVPSLDGWMEQRQRLVLHAGGQSRRLPAYAALGKAFVPVPLTEGVTGPRLPQALCDLQVPVFAQTLEEAGSVPRVLLASGDAWLDFDPADIPPVEDDFVGVGMTVSPEMARHFGVFFVRREREKAGSSSPIAFFLQKPDPETIYSHLEEYSFYVDTGLWLLSAHAVRFLFAACQCPADRLPREGDGDDLPAYLDFYGELAVALGEEPREAPGEALGKLNELTSSVVALEDARFHHLGSSRQLFESMAEIQEQAGSAAARKHRFDAFGPPGREGRADSPVWMDNVAVEDPPYCEGWNLVTGLPKGSSLRRLGRRWCVDCLPVGENEYVLRPYHLDDAFRGSASEGALFCAQPFDKWLEARELALDKSGDLQELPLFPVLSEAEIQQEFLDWFFTADRPDAVFSTRFVRARRLSAAQIGNEVNFARTFAQAREGLARQIDGLFAGLAERYEAGAFRLDFAALADLIDTHFPDLREGVLARAEAILANIHRPEHAARFHVFLDRLQGGSGAGKDAGFAALREAVVRSARLNDAHPARALKEDQIVWARSPVRLDLAGGWTDTPPYCYASGGAVLNLAVNLNGQPPVQAFVRPMRENVLRIHSIDLGISETVSTYEEIAAFRDPRSGFSLPKAGLALAGFHPDFFAGKAPATLERHLETFGGGLELSLLCAIPKGSGLGTSSVLAATLLAALARACGHDWDKVDLYRRVLAMEQLLTTGGGWQDQAGALFGGVKLIETQPGHTQSPTVRYLPSTLFGPEAANQTVLLYYTGITRLAKGILQEIVTNMFLGRAGTEQILARIGDNARHLFESIQTGREEAAEGCVRRSWKLNCALDPDTTNPQVEDILARVREHLTAHKLLGAGGGGYLLLFTPSLEAGRKVRQILEEDPPNERARFVDFDVSTQGLTVTVS